MSRAASAHSSGNSSDEGTTSRAVGLGGGDAAGDPKPGSRAPSSVGKKSKKRDKEAKKVWHGSLSLSRIDIFFITYGI